MNVVPDASVVVKWYVPERHHQQARDLRDDYLDGDHDFFAPELLPFEAINALRYSGFYDDDRLIAASESLNAYDIELRSFARSGDVAGVADELDVTVYDASYLALAEAVDGRAYTADETLLSDVEDRAYGDRLAHIDGYGRG